MDDYTRLELLKIAASQASSVDDIIAGAERLKRFITGDDQPIAALEAPRPPRRHLPPEVDAEVVTEVELPNAEPEQGRTKRRYSRRVLSTTGESPRTRKQWTAEEIARAERLYDDGIGTHRLAQVLGRTLKSIQTALSVGRIKPKTYKPSEAHSLAGQLGNLARKEAYAKRRAEKAGT